MGLLPAREANGDEEEIFAKPLGAESCLTVREG
jgi:hypothetical protein